MEFNGYQPDAARPCSRLQRFCFISDGSALGALAAYMPALHAFVGIETDEDICIHVLPPPMQQKSVAGGVTTALRSFTHAAKPKLPCRCSRRAGRRGMHKQGMYVSV